MLGDYSFYSLNGEEVSRETLVQHMIDYYNNKYPNVGITDFNEGSEVRNLLESIATDIFHMEMDNQLILRACFLATTYGTYLDLYGEEYNTPRIQASQSWGTVTFSISEPVNYLITIPQYTILVSSKTGLYYQTNMTVEIPIGETTVDCPAFSTVPGAGTNAEAGTINLFEDTSKFREVSVTNTEPFEGGANNESDEDYRNRLLAVKSQDKFGSREYYNRIGNQVKGVHDVLLVPSANDYDAKVLVNGHKKPLAPSILTEVTGVYTAEQNLVYNQSFEVAEVGYTDLNLEITAGVSDEVDTQLFIDALTNFIDGGVTMIAGTEFSSRGLLINGFVTNYVLLTLLETLPFVVQVTSLTSDGELFNKIIPDENTVIKLGDVSVVQDVVE